MKPTHQKLIVVVGAGNVGLQTVCTLALVFQLQIETAVCVSVVDFDRVEQKDVGKEYHRRLVGQYKADAAVEQIRLFYGAKTAARFRPIRAAAQSLPGLLREADAVFNATDSNLAAAYVSEQARYTLELRLSTGLLSETALHTIEVLPAGVTLGEASYDDRAWADTARYSCRAGLPQNVFAGITQPFGAVTAALAVHLMLACMQNGTCKRYSRIRVCGADIRQSFGAPHKDGDRTKVGRIRVSYDRPLSDLWLQAAKTMKTDADNILLVFPVPLVARRCTDPSCGAVYQGFERQPPKGRCAACGRSTCRLAAPREVCPADVRPIAGESLKNLYTPAGMGFSAWTGGGRKADFYLPFRYTDVPALCEGEG